MANVATINVAHRSAWKKYRNKRVIKNCSQLTRSGILGRDLKSAYDYA